MADMLPADLEEEPDQEELAPLLAEAGALPMYRQLGLARPAVPALGVLVNVVMQGPHARARLAVDAHFTRPASETAVPCPDS